MNAYQGTKMNRIYVKQLLTDLIGKDYVLCSRLESDYMNVSYVIRDKNRNKYILTLPNGKTNKIIDRKAQKQCYDIISQLDITNEDIYFDTNRGIRLSKYIEGQSLNENYDVDFTKLANLLHKLHSNQTLLDNDYNPFDRLAYYENAALKYRQESNNYRIIRDFLTSHIAELESNYHKCICHNNLQYHNVIAGKDENYYLINFEFAANNDPIYDIATFAPHSLSQAEELLKHYYDKIDNNTLLRFYLWRILNCLKWHNMLIAKHYQKEGINTGKNFLTLADLYLKYAIYSYNKAIKL